MENKEVAVRAESQLIGREEVTKDTIMSYMTSFGLSNSLQPNEIQQFVEIAMAYKLNPFKREIYCVPYNGQYGRKLSIITGYEVYLKRAERCGDMNGWSVSTSGSGDDTKAIVTIHRKSWANPFVHEVVLKEYNQNNQMWKSKPLTMLKKVAIAQAFRMAFPDEFGGMPYTSDELPDEMTSTATAKPVIREPGMKKPELKPKADAVVAEVVEPKPKDEPKKEEPDGSIEEATVLTISQNMKTKTFTINTDALGSFSTEKEVLAQIAKSNKGKLVGIKYTVDNDFNRVLLDIIPSK